MPSISHSQKQNRGGRPRKQLTTAAAAKTTKESDQGRYQRSRQPPKLANFIAYKLVLCANVPTETRAEIDLLTSTNIPIPQDSESQLSNNLLSVQSNQQRVATAFTADEGADTNKHAEINAEQYEYSASILLRADELDTITPEIPITG